jgi:hypothetical protein
MVFHLPFLRAHDLIRAASSFLLTTFLMCLASPVRAELILGAEVSVAYEDNIVGLLSGGGGSSGTSGSPMGTSAMQAGGKGFGGGGGGMGSGTAGGRGSYIGAGSQSPGDLSVSIMAELGVSGDAGDRYTFYALGFAERIDYQEFSEYDQAAAGVNAGTILRVSDAFAAILSGNGESRRYDNDPNRDGTGYRGSASLKQLVTDDLWLRAGADYETYRASYRDFSNRGPAYRFTAGYDLTDDLLLKAGYRFQSRQYQDIAATVLRTRTALLGMDCDLTGRWSTWLAYERQTTQPGTSDIITRNNIFSLTLRWDY